MSDPDRGAYTPPSERLAFDPREPVRSGGPAPVTLIVSGLLLLAIIGGVFLVYSHGVRRKDGAPVAVGAPLAEIKTPAPADTSNASSPGLTVDKVAAANSAPAFVPAPEEPLPRPTPVHAAASVRSAERLAEAAEDRGDQRRRRPARSRPPAPLTAKPAKAVTIASLTDAALAQKPAAKPAPKPAAPPPLVAAPAATAPAPAPGAGWVQIGAFSSSALADKGWGDLVMIEPAAMAGKGKKVETVSKDGKTFYRTYVTGFSSREGAQAFCDRLKAVGKSCFVK